MFMYKPTTSVLNTLSYMICSEFSSTVGSSYNIGATAFVNHVLLKRIQLRFRSACRSHILIRACMCIRSTMETWFSLRSRELKSEEGISQLNLQDFPRIDSIVQNHFHEFLIGLIKKTYFIAWVHGKCPKKKQK